MANQLAEIPYQVVHCNPERMRIRIEQLRRDSAYASLLKQLVESLCAITSVRLNSLASSIIIHYDASIASGDTLHKQLATCIQQAGLIEAQQQPSTVETDNLKVQKNAPSDSNHLDSSLDKIDQQKAPASMAVTQTNSLPTSSDIEAKTPPTSKTRLKQSALAQRLGVKSQMITRHKQKPEFSTWSMALDPDGKGWSYDPVSHSFEEVQPHTTTIEQSLVKPDEAHNQENRDEAVGELIGKTGGEIIGECVGGLVGDLMLGPVGGALLGEAMAAVGEEIGDAFGKKVVDVIEQKWDEQENSTDKPEPNENK